MLLSTPTRAWVVSLKNTGPGTALLVKTLYSATVVAEGREHGIERASADELYRQVTRLGFKEDHDFAVTKIGPESSIEPGGSIRLCELPPDAPERLKALDIEITYMSLLGDSFSKLVHCIPERGIPPMTLVNDQPSSGGLPPAAGPIADRATVTPQREEP